MAKIVYVTLLPSTARSTDFSVDCATCADTRAHRCSSYLWSSCCDHLQGSISASHFCSRVQTVPSAQVHRGHLKTITTTWFWKITGASISAAKKAKGTNVQSNHPECQRMWNELHRCMRLPLFLLDFKMSKISQKGDCQALCCTALIKPWSVCSCSALVSWHIDPFMNVSYINVAPGVSGLLARSRNTGLT